MNKSKIENKPIINDDSVISVTICYTYTEGSLKYAAETLEVLQRQRGFAFIGGDVIQHITKVYKSGRVQTEKIVLLKEVKTEREDYYCEY